MRIITVDAVVATAHRQLERQGSPLVVDRIDLDIKSSS
jgi:hypothetical protein